MKKRGGPPKGVNNMARVQEVRGKILALPIITSTDGFTVRELHTAMSEAGIDMDLAALKSTMRTWQVYEKFSATEVKCDGNLTVRYRLRIPCREILAMPWRQTGNDWLGLEPRVGVQW